MKRQMKPSGVPTSGRLPGDIRHPTTDIPEVGGRKLEVEKVKSPRIRFKEFGGAWEARPLGDEGKTVSGVGFPEAEQGGVVGTPFFKVSDMSNPGNESLMVRANNYVSEEQIRKHSWHPVENLPAILFAKVGAAALLNRKRLVKNRFLMDNNMMAYCLNDGCNGDFFKVLFESIDLSSFVQVGALPSINGKDVESKVARFPSLPEQRRIAELFRNLDETIAATDARLEKLRQSKKSLLEKMFPRPGASVPEIRFKEFEGEWRESIIGDLFEERLERSGEKLLLSVTMAEGVIPATENGKRDNSSADKSNYKCVYPGDLAYNSMRMWQGACGASNHEGIVSPAYTIMKPHHGTDSFFFVLLFKRQASLQVFRAFSQGLTSDTWNLKFPILSTISFKRPSLPEQQRIGSFFRELDKLIESVQKKAAKLRQVKSALLEEMFA